LYFFVFVLLGRLTPCNVIANHSAEGAEIEPRSTLLRWQNICAWSGG